MTIRPTGSINSYGTNDVLKVERPYYEQAQFNTELSYCQPEENYRNSICHRLNNIKPMKIIFGLFPVLTWLTHYNIKNDLVGDIVSGCTVAIMHIPQGN